MSGYYRQQRDFIKAGQMPLKFNTPIAMAALMIAGFVRITSSIRV